MIRKLRKNKQGFSLLEIVFAMGVLVVGIVGVMALFPVGLKASKRSGDFTMAAILAQRTLEDVKAAGFTVYGNDGWYSGANPGVPQPPGLNSSPFGDEPSYSWVAQVEDVRTGLPPVLTVIPNLKQITLDISWLDREDPGRIVSLLIWLIMINREKKVGRRRKSQVAGFTLVEILVAVAILTIIMSSIAMSFKGGTTAWTKGTARMERYLNARAALDMMSREISSAMVNDWSAGTNGRINFLGFDEAGQSGWKASDISSDELFFIAPPSPGDATNGNPYEIGYWLNTSSSANNSLIRHYTTNLTDFDFSTNGGAWQLNVIVENITDLQFEYYDPTVTLPANPWQDTWDSSGGSEQDTLPNAVKITITVAGEVEQETKDFSTIVYLPLSG